MARKRKSYHRDDSRDGVALDQRPNGKWRARVWDRHAPPTKPGGKRGRYRCVTRDTPEEAMEAAEAERGKVALRMVRTGSCDLGSLWAAYKIERMGRGRTQEKTVAAMQCLVDRLTEAKATDLNAKGFRAKLAKFFQDLVLSRSRAADGRVAVSTRRRMLSQIRALINYAIDTGQLASDPLRKFQVAGDREQADIAREVLSVADARRLVALGHIADPVWIHCMLMLFAGLRDAEAERLKWSDYDKESRVLYVRKGKGGKARSVPVQPELAAILARVSDAIGPTAKNPCMPSVPIAKPTPGRNLRRYELYVKLLDGAGVVYDRGEDEISGMRRRLVKHSMRHTFTAAMLATGEPGDSLRIIMGHSEEDLTTHYGAQVVQYKAIVADEGWPRGELHFAAPPSRNVSSASGKKADD